MKLPKGHIVKTSVKYEMKMDSLEDFIKQSLIEIDNFTGYIRILADNGEYEEEIKAFLFEGEIIGGERKLISSGTVFYGNECGFDSCFEFIRCGLSVVRLTSNDISMVKISYPECIINRDLQMEEQQETNNREDILKKYRIKELSDSEITDLLEKLNGD
ncbi:MAG: hypothetical protein APG12_01312 [Candidatus Methanofastidiosum methylothiophilum]|uniref:Uncharacterized protein n=1 Tax=Candidatus Methanofastidiosum methylothiophilum TaxID=1705564 RepID=A0A150IXN3_9EURY|nr:MAG: hypothetical protein APG10_01150 [Candidatus Methanofastidiosum methylthiophilus]KYC48508.1 MAG: hypothetical protein APG11_00315 [Candidatus Methanofastidiosum methylthiophilus]KYC49665.1 MAG: hypothetical protein APG12_01312 [Candidatus Methanofastidiosum methylthiophilus]